MNAAGPPTPPHYFAGYRDVTKEALREDLETRVAKLERQVALLMETVLALAKRGDPPTGAPAFVPLPFAPSPVTVPFIGSTCVTAH